MTSLRSLEPVLRRVRYVSPSGILLVSMSGPTLVARCLAAVPKCRATPRQNEKSSLSRRTINVDGTLCSQEHPIENSRAVVLWSIVYSMFHHVARVSRNNPTDPICRFGTFKIKRFLSNLQVKQSRILGTGDALANDCESIRNASRVSQGNLSLWNT